MVASAGGRLVLTGGRVSAGVGFSGGDDVWRSEDGRNWSRAPAAAWPARSYHLLLGPDEHGCLFLLAGQTFTHFYSDVWRTCDEADTWTQLTERAEWPARAGPAGTVHRGKLVIAGGCHDSVPYDPGFFRGFFSDVWSSSDGLHWELLTETPGWKGRSGPRLVSLAGRLVLVAGEVGFTGPTQLGDVWASGDDGRTWSQLQAAPAFSPRSGHGVVATTGYLVLIAGWPELSDLYYSLDGAEWTRSAGLAWNCNSTACGKFDFWPVVHKGSLLLLGGSGSSSTFGKLYSETWALNLASTLPLSV